MSTPNPIPMTSDSTDSELDSSARLEAELESACARIAPTWPLDRFIAVNPFWEMTEKSPAGVSAELSALSGARLVMPRAWYREQWEQGHLTAQHLREAIAQTGSDTTVEHLQDLLQAEQPPTVRRLRVTDVADQKRDLVRQVSWRDFVIHSVSQFCASYFDEGQSQDAPPANEDGLYRSWRRQAQYDKSPVLLMGLGEYASLAPELPQTATEMAQLALDELDVPASDRQSYLLGLLLDLGGWAAWGAYRRWSARLEGGDDHEIRELLAIQLAWEWMLLRAGGPGIGPRWRLAMAAWPKADTVAADAQGQDWLLQRAMEIAWQQPVCKALPEGLDAPPRSEPPAAQAAFCIDVRSEVFRRALETTSDQVQTMGFAGFFGMPVEYQPLGTASARPQLPGLLAPKLRVTDLGAALGTSDKRVDRLEAKTAWRSFKTNAISTFSFVESVGMFFAGKLLGDAFGRSRRSYDPERAGLSAADDAARKPRLTEQLDGQPVDPSARADLAAGILRAMSLTRGFARVVALVGHGSETRNNPHAAGYDCGACCGQAGDANARAAAALLNEPEVRAALLERGIEVPAHTHFVGGLHNTTTDEVTLFDLDELPASHAQDIAQLQQWLRAAGNGARRERAKYLGLPPGSDEALRAAIEARSRDWAQVRPEWGLANNAAFIVAPREHCQHLDLQGRSFLHDYRYEQDEGFGILELIMTAPMVVTHWINFQYYASTVDNLRYGSGNKVLHNVVGGHLGVFEGNGGDLRIGLPMQALHDGEQWFHTPLRLSVFIEAPRDAIDGILRKHDKVRELVDNEWLYLFQLDPIEREVRAYRGGDWVSTAPTEG
ncbi:MAG: DUF2309 domain-containing protein [Nannocystaceae bacterium]